MRNQRGASNNGAKLTEQQVISVKSLFAKGVSQKRIARLTNMSRANIWNIVHDKSWVHVKPDINYEVPVEIQITEKQCPSCNEIKPVTEFRYRARSRTGRDSFCRLCHNRRSTELRILNRLQAFSILGNQCACCAENRPEFLAPDHIRGGGGAERKLVGINGVIRRIISRQFDPGEFRLLCHNCNLSYGFYGYCPHSADASTKFYNIPPVKKYKVAKGTHGTASAYRWCGPPRCDDCKLAMKLSKQKMSQFVLNLI